MLLTTKGSPAVYFRVKDYFSVSRRIVDQLREGIAGALRPYICKCCTVAVFLKELLLKQPFFIIALQNYFLLLNI
jgi:hypothetical protein